MKERGRLFILVVFRNLGRPEKGDVNNWMQDGESTKSLDQVRTSEI